MSEKTIDVGLVSLLIPQFKAGDTEAREQLVQALQQYLERVADQQMDPATRRKAGASDIVQLSLMRIVEKFDQFRGSTSAELHAWIKRIVINETNKVRRSFHTEKRDMQREISMDRQTESQPERSPQDVHLTPASSALKSERREKFHEVLELLPADYAQVIRLRSLEGLSFREVGERMDRSEDAATQLWYRAMLKFEEKLVSNENFQSQLENQTND
jgi:RNA polymerase sigma-70 factor (ECF subfamily)